MKTLMTSTAVALTMLALPALAQTQTVPPATATMPATPAMTPPPETLPPRPGAATEPPAMTAPTAPTAPMTSASGSKTIWYTRSNDDVRTSKLIGAIVKNQAGETVGDVNDVLVDKSGRIAAVVLGVGGFLGLGEHEVAVAFDALRVTRDANNANIITVNATKDALKNAPAWTWPR